MGGAASGWPAHAHCVHASRARSRRAPRNHRRPDTWGRRRSSRRSAGVVATEAAAVATTPRPACRRRSDRPRAASATSCCTPRRPTRRRRRPSARRPRPWNRFPRDASPHCSSIASPCLGTALRGHRPELRAQIADQIVELSLARHGRGEQEIAARLREYLREAVVRLDDDIKEHDVASRVRGRAGSPCRLPRTAERVFGA